MKRINRRLLAVVASSALALPMAAQVQADEMEVPEHSHAVMHEHEHDIDGAMVPMHAHETEEHSHAEFSQLHGHSATVYGALNYGVTMTDDGVSGSSTGWEIGSNWTSKFGLKGSVGAGAGLTAGFHFERAIDAGLSARHHNVSLSGAFGTLALGQQGSPYYGATSWSGAAQLGGVSDGASRITGVSFTSALGGPFGFSILAGDGGAKGGADHIEVSGSLAAGPVSLGAGYMEQVDGGDRFGGTVKGTAANITLLVGYETANDITCIPPVAATKTHDEPSGHTSTAAVPAKICDEDRYGFTLSYLVGEGPGGGNAFLEYGQRDSDDATATERDLDHLTLGYSYYVSDAVTVDLVHRTQDAYNEDNTMRLTSRTSAVVMKVAF